MAIAFVASGGWVSSAGTLSVPYPSGVADGQMLVLYVTGRYSNAVTPTVPGFTIQTTSSAVAAGGVGTNGVDTGTTKIWLYTREADGSETGNVTVTTSGNNFQAIIESYSKTGDTWDAAASVGADETLGTAYSVTGNLAIGFQPDDVLLSATVIASDTPTFSSEAFTATGVTFGTGTSSSSVSTVNSDQKAFLHRRFVTAGTASIAPTYTGTLSVADAGSTGFLRLREVGGGPPPPPESGAVSYIAAFNGNSAATDVVTQACTLSGVLAGDLLIATVQWNNLLTSAVTVTSGWTVVGGDAIDDAASSTLFAYKFASGGETSFSATWTTPTTLRCDIEVVQYRGVDPTALVIGTPSIETGTDTVHNCPAITTASASWIVNLLGVRQTGLTGWTPPAGYTQRAVHVQGASGTNAIGVFDTNGTVSAGSGLGAGNYTTAPGGTAVANGGFLTFGLKAAPASDAVPNAGPNQGPVASLSVVQLDSSGSTGAPSTFEWRIVSGGGSLSSTTAANPTFTAPASVAGVTVVIGLKVGAPTIGTAEDTMTVEVLPHINWALISSAWAPTKIVTL